MHGFYAFAWFEAARGAGTLALVDENEPSGVAEEAQRGPKAPTTTYFTSLFNCIQKVAFMETILTAFKRCFYGDGNPRT